MMIPPVRAAEGSLMIEVVDAEREQIERKALTITERAAAVVIRDQSTYDGAAELLRGVKELRREAEAHHRPVIDAAHKAHKAACDALNRIDGPLKQAEMLVKGRIGVWDMEQERIRREQQRLLEAEAARLAAEAAEREIEAAEAAGASPAEVAAIIAEAESAPVVVALPPPAYQKADGVAVRKSYSPEVVSLPELVRHIAAHPELVNLLTPNMTALRSMARAQGAQFRMPGVRLVEVANVAVR